jgi:hypothetical protein
MQNASWNMRTCSACRSSGVSIDARALSAQIDWGIQLVVRKNAKRRLSTAAIILARAGECGLQKLCASELVDQLRQQVCVSRDQLIFVFNLCASIPLADYRRHDGLRPRASSI